MNTELFSIVDVPIITDDVIQKVKSVNVGAITVFIGTVRELTNGKKTLSLEYQAYESMAVKKLAKIGEEIIEKWPNTKVAITHRVGKLNISDVAVVIAVSSPHREAAYEANAFAIERIKQIVPIWKKEYWEDGTKWIGDQLEKQSFESK
ncbi:molybdenum cofactor biosynthesis protein MoaE [Rummeliibacillus suwonensis]|uniref:molybdenum cofactor biosynthesis protein MoaE n=1 Tax=Rummeliibacillus suwonensis TaxID=1306154 RepID=UPI0011B4010D|nr:molybdenum cofactor biosynthesis protein MoaE [Rummeliibacillus suwonensis]